MKGTIKTQPHTYKMAAFVTGHSADCCSDCYRKESDPIHHLTPTKRLSWRTKADQFFQSFGCGQTHVIKFMGTCEGCGRSVYSHECAGARPCDDVLEDSPDPRGMIPAEHCMNLYHANEHNLAGRDLLTCAACADDGDKYRAIIATAKGAGTWKESNWEPIENAPAKAKGYQVWKDAGLWTVYQITKLGEPAPTGESGYRSLTALLKLKNIL